MTVCKNNSQFSCSLTNRSTQIQSFVKKNNLKPWSYSHESHLELAYAAWMDVLLISSMRWLSTSKGRLDQILTDLSPPLAKKKKTTHTHSFEGGPLQPHANTCSLAHCRWLPFNLRWLFNIPKAPAAVAIVAAASEQIIEMHQRRRVVGVKN